jgi:hypothetical protein
MKRSSSTNLDLILVLLLLAVLGCVCPNTNQRNSQTDGTSNENTKANQAPPTVPSPSVAPTPAKTDLETPQTSERIKKGEAVYKRVSSSTGLPIMFGWQAKDITLMIPAREWNKLSATQKVDLTYFMDTLAGVIRDNPEPYVSRWSAYYRRTEQLERGGEFDGLYRDGYLNNARSICSSCWSIATGTIKKDGFYDEDYPVKGASADSFRSSFDNAK